jgi:hypothetical protein
LAARLPACGVADQARNLRRSPYDMRKLAGAKESVSMEDAILPSLGSKAVKLFTDKTPNAIILSRILARSLDFIHCTDLRKEESHDFIDLVVLISRKMLSVWSHLQAYKTEEQRLREKLWANPDATPEHSQELYEEFDVFSVQVKSTLDHLVQMLRPVHGRKMTMYTFADKGEGYCGACSEM